MAFSRHDLSDEQWSRVELLMTGRPGQLGGVADDNRRFLNAVIYINKTGVPWRDLPLSFGLWDTVYHRFNEWCKKGRWQRIFEALQDPDLEWLMIDSTVIRAHQHAAGLNTDANDEDLGRSRGGFGTKIRAGFDALGNPVAFELSPGQEADVTHAEAVIGDRQPEVVIGDKGYDSDAFVETLRTRGIDVVIPPRANRTAPRDYDAVLYRERNKAERGFNLLKHYRRVATRYEKRSRNFLGMVLVAAFMILLR